MKLFTFGTRRGFPPCNLLEELGQDYELVLAGIGEAERPAGLLAVNTSGRLDEFPNVPTLLEAGGPQGVPSIAAIMGPPGMPKDRVDALHNAFHKAVQEPGYIELSNRLTFKPAYANDAGLQKRIDAINESSGHIFATLPK